VSRALHDSGAGPTAAAVSNALAEVAIVWFVVAYLRRLVRPGGLVVRDFRAGESAMALVHTELRWLLPILPPTVFFYALILPEQQESIFAGFSRAAFVALMLMMVVFTYRIAHPERALLRPYFDSSAGEWLGRLRYVVFAILVGLPAILGLFALAGYFFTAMILISRFIFTVLLIIALLLARALMLNWLRHARRKAVLNQHLRMQEEKGEPGTSTDARALLEEAVADFEAVDSQTRQVFRGLLILASLIGFSAIWFSVLPALEGLDRVELYPRFLHVHAEGGATQFEPVLSLAPAPQESEAVGPTRPTLGPLLGDRSAESSPSPGVQTRVSLRDLLLALLILTFTVAAIRNLPGLVEILLLQRLPLDSGTRYAVAMIIRYVLTVVGLLAALETVELGWSKVQWLVAALTFGLGFGLQEVFANFVSGLILLFERPIRVGDIVTVSSTNGRVERTNMRATTIKDLDNKELVVPNKDFITKEVINWTLSDSVLRLTVEVGVAYGSDVEKALKILRQVAENDPMVLSTPPPVARFLKFGDSALTLKLFAFTESVDKRLEVYDALHRAIDAAYRKEGIVIAFPQLDVHVSSPSA